MDPGRVIADLRELDRLTGGEGRRAAGVLDPEWQAARALVRERLAELPVEVEVDAAGNLWATLAGRSDSVVVVGSHVDSVPAGGWLDGSLGVMAALEVLRDAAERGTPEHTLALVDWADEEGARFGASLFGSSGFAGTLDIEKARGARDADGVAMPDALAACGVDLDQAVHAGEQRRSSLLAYLELHIEQGPVLEAEQIGCCAVEGTFGVRRWKAVFSGHAAHAGSTPMARRRDAGVAAARFMAGLPALAVRHGGVSTTGRVDLSPGIVTAVAGRAEVLVDQRALAPAALEELVADALELATTTAAAESCTFTSEPIWRIEPVAFHPGLVDLAERECAHQTGSPRRLPSGALHDAAELARLAPAAMVFVSSIGGVSHAPEEDTPVRDLEQAIAAFGQMAATVVAEGVP